MSLISVIIPAFNAETSILIAISSVLRQTYKNFEIIVIDDGSSDKTSDIVKSCGEKVIYSYQKKKGVAEARNRGIDMAKGEYIMFLDADDYFEPVIMKHLLTIDSKGDSDFVVGNMYLENLKKQRVINYNFKKSEKIELKKKEDWEAAFKIVGNSTAGKLFKRTIIGNTRFPIFGIGEDALFMLEVMLKSTCISVCKTPLYVYVQNPFSVTRREVALEVIENCIKVHDQKRKLISKYNYLKEINGVLNDYYLKFFLMYANKIRQISDNKIKDLCWERWLVVNRMDFVKDSFVISLCCFISTNINWVYYFGMLFTGKFYRPLIKRIKYLNYYKH